MRWKTTVILLLVTVGIGFYISLYEIKQPTPEERKQLSKQVVSIGPDSVSQIVIDAPAVKISLSRNEAAWKISPKKLRANNELIERILSELYPLNSQRVLSGSAERVLELKAYGLDPSLGSLTLTVNGKPTTLFIGETTAVNSNRYLRVDNRPDIFVVSSSLFETLNQPQDKFRDPILMHLNSWEVKGLEISSAKTAFALTSSEGDWDITKPFYDRADRNEITSLLNGLSQINIKRFVDDRPQIEQLSSWGFENPKAEITLRLSADSASTLMIFFGKALQDEPSLLFAKRADEPYIYAVASSDVESLLKDAKILRSKNCFEFFTSNVNKVELSSKTAGWTIEQTEGKWRQLSSKDALDTGRVNEFLSKLSDFRLLEFIDDSPSDLSRYGLDTAKQTGESITIWTMGHDQPQRLLVGFAIEGSKERYGLIEGRRFIVKLPALANDLLATTCDSLRSSTTNQVSETIPSKR